MMKRVKRSWLFAVAVVMMLLVVSCDTIMDLFANEMETGGGSDNNNDKHNDDDKPVAVSNVSFDKSDIFIAIGGSVLLSPTIEPDNAANKTVSWSSENESIATVGEDGTVTSAAVGTTTITVTTEDGGKTAPVSVTVVHFIITNENEWNQAFDFVSAGDDGAVGNLAVYVLRIQGDFTVAGKTSDSTFTGAYKEVWLTGDGTVGLSTNGSLVRVEANQTLIIDGPTLVGRTENVNSVVYLSGGGSAELKSGTICDNATSSGGGGVYVFDTSTFTMSGGEISGNSSTSVTDGGGGVYVSDNTSTFTMSGGEISDNSTISENGGGGVYVTLGAAFNMNGGVISGNSAVNSTGDGGGVYIIGSAATMNDGEISGNSAKDYGGGVYVVSGTFNMNGGVISNNSAGGGARGHGGGVAVYNGASFTMSVNSAEDNGGVISGNTAANYGGGVYVAYTSTFTMSVGTIYGSEASDPLKNTASANKGAAVYCSSTKKEEDTIYSYSYSYSYP